MLPMRLGRLQTLSVLATSLLWWPTPSPVCFTLDFCTVHALCHVSSSLQLPLLLLYPLNFPLSVRPLLALSWLSSHLPTAFAARMFSPDISSTLSPAIFTNCWTSFQAVNSVVCRSHGIRPPCEKEDATAYHFSSCPTMYRPAQVQSSRVCLGAGMNKLCLSLSHELGTGAGTQEVKKV